MQFTPLPQTKARRRLFLMRHAAVSYVNADGSPVVDTNNVELRSGMLSCMCTLPSVM